MIHNYYLVLVPLEELLLELLLFDGVALRVLLLFDEGVALRVLLLDDGVALRVVDASEELRVDSVWVLLLRPEVSDELLVVPLLLGIVSRLV